VKTAFVGNRFQDYKRMRGASSQDRNRFMLLIIKRN